MCTGLTRKVTYYGSKDRNQIRQALTIAQRKRLPKEKTPPKEEEHISRALIKSCDRNTGFGGEGYEDRVDGRHCKPSEPGISAHR
jgi:hypothetical protein